ncbi:MAG: hypothetical protein AAFS11_00810 [Planctomycetota bacterium]
MISRHDADVIEYLATHDAACPTCGYQLRALSKTRCPECGKRFTFESLIAASQGDGRDRRIGPFRTTLIMAYLICIGLPATTAFAIMLIPSLLLVLDGNWSGVPSALTTLLALSVFGPGPVALMVWWLQRDEASRRAIS